MHISICVTFIKTCNIESAIILFQYYNNIKSIFRIVSPTNMHRSWLYYTASRIPVEHLTTICPTNPACPNMWDYHDGKCIDHTCVLIRIIEYNAHNVGLICLSACLILSYEHGFVVLYICLRDSVLLSELSLSNHELYDKIDRIYSRA